MNISNWSKLAYQKLINVHNCQLDIEVLLMFVLKKNKSWIIGFNDYQLSLKEINQLDQLLIRRSLGEPIAYLIGEKEFWSLVFRVSKDTFIPRPDSEILVELCLHKLCDVKRAKILDLGTGSGAIAISIAYNKNDCHVVGVDYQQKILSVAQYNANKLNIKNINFILSDWFYSLKSCMFDIIVSNPPYISYNEFSCIQSVLKYEPMNALVSNYNGLADIQYIINNASNYLYNHGWLLIEHSWNQKIMVQKIFFQNNFINIKTYKDFGKNDRVTIGQKIINK
ncbi:Release factor glutamine methyltransferase [Buchnera aphidicola (Eriosoma grossulariae)]|uniref:peptide chain release factor N(5)-glutamine methyltransferase n=1 Tax=Buchnera aphidicola TaxID=9 RepID=UPI00346485DF